MMKLKKTLIVSSLGVLISGCATTKPAMEDHSLQFGQAIAANIAAQAVAPTDQQKANTYIPANRERRELANRAYRENAVPEPVTVNTTK